MSTRWKLGHFGDVLKSVSRPAKVEPSQQYRILGMRWYAQGLFVKDVKLGQEIRAQELYRVESGDFVYNRLFAWKGSFGIVDSVTAGGYVSGEFPYFNVNANQADAKFLHCYLAQEKIWQTIADNSTGQTNVSRLRLKEQDFLRMELPLPPLPEQQRIVARIEALARRVDEARGLRREAIEEANNLVNAHLSAIVRDLEKKCEIQPLEKLLVEAGYGTSVKCESERINGAIPVLRIPNVASEKVTLVDLKYGFLSNAEVKKTMLREGDLLIVRTNGSADLVGRCAVVPNLPEATAFASYMIRIRCNAEKIHPHFLQLILRHQRTAGQLIDFARTTAGQYNVSLGRLRNTKIPLPPLDEQHRVVAYLESLQQKVDELRGLQAATQKELDALMPSVLAKAFAGEL